MDHILYLTAHDVARACQELDPVEAVTQALALHASGETILPDEAYLAWQNAQGEGVRSLNMPGYLGGELTIAGTKIINGNPANATRGLPRASGMTMLFDPATGSVRCIMEGAQISALRTASVTALSSRLLGHARTECVALIGAGALAAAHAELLPTCLPALSEVRLFDLEPARAAALAARLMPSYAERGQRVIVAASAEEAIRSAQLIVPVTTTTTGYIPFDWLQPGSLTVNVSLDDVLSDVVFGVDLLVVDDWHLVSTDDRRLLGRMYRRGEVVGPSAPAISAQTARRVDAELGEIITGKKPGRTSPDDIILVNPFGLSIEDVALAVRVEAVALRLGIGLHLER